MKIILFIVGAIYSIISFRFFTFGYAWILVYWLICFGLLALISKKTVQKKVFFNLAFIIFILGILEGYSFYSLNKTRYEGGYTQEYRISDEILGYAPTKGKRFTAKKYMGNQLLYDVSYTINDLGLRISASSERPNNNQCILFFGCSYTFGEGVEDYESMPYVVQKFTPYKVYNFGFHGYGPHQMLSAIQHGRVKDIIKNCTPRIVIYQTALFHASRSAGFASWGHHGPKYILRPSGALAYVGHFDDEENDEITIRKLLLQSYVYQKYFNISYGDIKLFVEIIGYSQKLLQEEYPDAEFHVIYWDKGRSDTINELVFKALRSKGVHIHLISQILPDYANNYSRYHIKDEGHPNALAHQRIAEYIVQRILPVREPMETDSVAPMVSQRSSAALDTK